MDREFQETYRIVADELREREIENPLPFAPVAVVGKWRASIPGYGPRRAYVANLFAPLISRIRDAHVAQIPRKDRSDGGASAAK